MKSLYALTDLSREVRQWLKLVDRIYDILKEFGRTR